MSTPMSSTWPDRSVLGAAWLAAGVGTCVLAGWGLDLPWLTSVVPGGTRMATTTAACFVLAGLSLAAARRHRHPAAPAAPDWISAFAWAGPVALVLIGLWQGVFGLTNASSAVAPGELLAAQNEGSTVRMGLATATGFVCCGLALISARARANLIIYQALAICAVITGWLGLSRYLFDGVPSSPAARMAIHTAFTLLALSLGLLCLRTEGGIMALFLKPGPGGIMARRLLPLAMSVPIILGWLCARGWRSGWFGAEVGFLAAALCQIGILGGLIGFVSWRLERMDRDRRKVEDTLRESENRFRSMADSVPVLFWLGGPDAGRTWFNRRWLDFVGRSPEEQEGHRWQACIHPEDRPRTLRLCEQAVARREPFIVDFRLRRGDGSWCWVADYGTPRHERGSEFVGYIGCAIDISDRVEAGHREAWLASFPEKNPNPITELDAKGVVHYINPAADRLFPELRLRSVNHPWLADFLTAVRSLIEARGGTVRREIETDGRVYSQCIDYVTETDRLRIYGSDITDLKKTESALARERDLLRLLVGHLPASIYVKDLEGRFVLYNQASLSFVGLRSESQALGKTVFDFFPRELAELYSADDRRVLETGEPIFNREEPTRDRTGAAHWYSTTKLPLRESGRIIGLIGISTDITERKENDQRLRAHLARLDLLRTTTHAIAQRQDIHSILLVVVQSLEEHFDAEFACVGLRNGTPETLRVACVGKRSRPIALQLGLAQDVTVDIASAGISAGMAGELVYEPNLTTTSAPFLQNLARAGLKSLVIAPLTLEGRVLGVVLTARTTADNFTSGECEFLRQLCEHVALAAHQAELHGDLQKAYADLRQSQQAVMQQERLRALGQMASGVAHDLNNAILPVALYCESLIAEETHLSPKGRDHLKVIQRAIGDVAQTITRMREFYRPLESRSNFEPVLLNEAVSEVLELSRARWRDIPQRRGVVIQVVPELTPDLPRILGIPSEVREALTNLVFNAIDALPNGGTITARTGIRGSPSPAAGVTTHADFPEFPRPIEVFVEISDTGSGMTEETRRRCLEPFYSTKGDRGTGLGLAIVYGIAQRHEAEIEIESRPNAGTTFRLVFAAAPDAPNPPTVTAAPEPRAPAMKLLVVDDDPLVANTLADVLAAEGHIVTKAAGGQAGIDIFHAAIEANAPFDAVITDLGMPHVDGLRVAAALKSRSPSTPIILLTGWGQRIETERDAPARVDHVLSKPPTIKKLRDTLKLCAASRSPNPPPAS